ncbi:MAG: hypothetical protein V4722_26645 [Bacteroidota bacterium]
MLCSCLSIKAQGNTTPLGSVLLATGTPGKTTAYGKSSLPVCTPRNQACNTTASLTYIFTGNGNWTDAQNWKNNLIPPVILPQNFEIIIDPLGTGECILNVRQTIAPGAKITIVEGKKLRVLKAVILQ